MRSEQLSPELVLVDPELGARARAALPDRLAVPLPARPIPSTARAEPAAPAEAERGRPYPFWARVTAALWLLVIGILIGGAAIPHAQDTPRVVPLDEDVASVCPAPQAPRVPDVGSPLRPGP